MRLYQGVSDSQERHWGVFRSHAQRLVELSQGEDLTTQGILVGGGEPFLDDVWRFASEFPAASDWLDGMRRFTSAFPAIRYLFRTDWRSGRLEAQTLYARLPDGVTERQFDLALAQSKALHWRGRSPFDYSAVMGLSAPHGLAARVDRSGNVGTAVYWYVNQPSYVAARTVLKPVGRWLGWPESSVGSMILTVQRIATAQGLAVLGVDGRAATSPTAVKLNLGEVPLTRAIPFLRERNVSPEHLQVLRQLALGLKLRRMSYFGVKMSETGLAGWRTYWSYHPMRQRSATQCRLVAPSADRPLPIAAVPAAYFTPLSFS